MANNISPLAQLFRGMADLIDRDDTSQTLHDAITTAAEALAARAMTQRLAAGPLWEANGASLLAAAYAFHAGLPRQAATATHIQALVEPSPAPPQGGDQALQATHPHRGGQCYGSDRPAGSATRPAGYPGGPKASAGPSSSPPGPGR